MSSDAKLVECAVCDKQLPSLQLSSHLSSPAHLACLTSRFHSLSAAFETQSGVVRALQAALDKAERSVEELAELKEESAPIAIFEWSGEESEHLQAEGGVPLRRDVPIPPTHPRGEPFPRHFYELTRDGQCLTLSPVEFHTAFTVILALNNYSWRENCHYLDAQRVEEETLSGVRTTDHIQIRAYQEKDRAGLAFLISREGYEEVEQCAVASRALATQRWHHVAASVDRGGVMRLFVDGELRAARQAAFAPRRAVRDLNRMGNKPDDGRAK